MAGPCLDRSMGVSVLVADTEDEAWALVRGDPAVAKGVMRAEVKAFRVSLWRS